MEEAASPLFNGAAAATQTPNYGSRQIGGGQSANNDSNNHNDNNNQSNMGPQSQRRVSQEKRTHNMQEANHGYQRKKKKGGGQLTLFGGEAFDHLKHCDVCRNKAFGKSVHRAHHPKCPFNRKTKGIVSKVTMDTLQEEKRLLKHFSAPLEEHEKGSFRHLTKDNMAAFFNQKRPSQKPTHTPTTVAQTSTADVVAIKGGDSDFFSPLQFSELVTEKASDEAFAKSVREKKAPLAIMAAAAIAVEKIIRPNDGSLISTYFNGLTMTIPPVTDCMDPHYQSIVGQKLLLVDWKKMMGVDVLCPSCKTAVLKNDRTNFSKNKILHPIFGLDGPPQWCMVMSMECPCCKRRFAANDSSILCRLPAFAAYAYPVDSRYAGGNKNSHVARSATDAFDMLLPTYGNGDLCSRLLYNAMNRAYLQSAARYYSLMARKRECRNTETVNETLNETVNEIKPFLEKDGEYMKFYPPTGDMIRDLYDSACHSSHNPWGISDHDRHTREIQGVQCSRIFSQDHTHEVTKNYISKKRLGVEGLWDVATETGEIACAVLVPSTKTSDFSHAAKQLAIRPHFKPQAMYSDTWPCKSDYWSLLLGQQVKGRLGLFHFIKRITGTLRKKHVDYNKSIADLLDCLYYYNDTDYNNLLGALKNGTLSSTGVKYTDDDIEDLNGTPLFRQRYSKYLRKEIRSPDVMRVMLEAWFNKYKCSSSDDVNRPAGGRLDPITQQPLFTPETRDNWLNCKEKAEYLQDPLPLDEMYFVIPPSPNSAHNLNEYLSRRGESSLESFHCLLAHFANCGMRDSLADNLNLTGTARFNLGIRTKMRIASATTTEERKKLPGVWESVVPYFNHSELAWVNSLSRECGIENKMPFPFTEKLGEDTGERFFSEYIRWIKSTKPSVDLNDMCLCTACKTGQNVSPTEVRAIANNTQPPTEMLTETLTETLTDSAHPVPQNIQQPVQQPVQNTQHMTMHNSQNVFLFLPPPPGFFIPPPSYTPMVCCQRYSNWFHNRHRRGRPPHDFDCRRKAITTPNFGYL